MQRAVLLVEVGLHEHVEEAVPAQALHRVLEGHHLHLCVCCVRCEVRCGNMCGVVVGEEQILTKWLTTRD